MQSALRKIGNSIGIVLPRPILGAMGVAGGTILDLTVEDGRLIGTPVKAIVRDGWETAAQAIGASSQSDTEAEWIDAINDSDANWTW